MERQRKMAKTVYQKKSNNYEAIILYQARLRPLDTRQRPSTKVLPEIKGKVLSTSLNLKTEFSQILKVFHIDRSTHLDT